MDSTKQKMIKGVFWSAVEKYSGLLVSIIVSMILARILNPSDYGTVAIASVIINFLAIVGTMGIAPAIIQRRDLNSIDINNIYTFTLIIACFFAIIFYFISLPVSNFYNDSNLIPVCKLLSVTLFFSIANMVPNALMAKYQKFKEIAKRTLLLQVLTGIVAVIAAFVGAGVFSLLISPVLSSVGIFLYNRKFFKLSISKQFTLEPTKRIFSYTSYTFAFDFINFFTRNLDKIIIGRYISMNSLGLYEKSYRLMQLPIQNVTAVINPVIQPVFAEFQDDKEAIALRYNKIIRFISTISFPLGVVLYFCAYEVIHIFYGGKWDGAVNTFQILALSLPLQMILSTVGFVYQSSNAPKYLFWTGLVNMLITVAGFLLSCIIWRTIEAVAWSWTITLCLGFFNSFFFLYKIVLKQSFLQMLKQMFIPFVNALFLSFLLYYLGGVIPENIWISTFVKFLTSCIVTVLIVHFLKQYNLLILFKRYRRI